MRGNPALDDLPASGQLSIPAYAGEPVLRGGIRKVGKVYPRVCGGTQGGHALVDGGTGLSPRMRGNLPLPPPILSIAWSIPAYAGEPPARRLWGVIKVVYPRVCGGTMRMESRSTRQSGLSPRMRGNLAYRPIGSGAIRSIPAYAGEPISEVNPLVVLGVYPRVCGGTCRRVATVTPHWGLSPRMRGNLRGNLP